MKLYFAPNLYPDERHIVSIQPTEECAAELRKFRLSWFWCVIDEDDLEKAIDLDGYSHARIFGGDHGTARKVWFQAKDEDSLRKELRRNHIKPRWGEINR